MPGAVAALTKGQQVMLRYWNFHRNEFSFVKGTVRGASSQAGSYWVEHWSDDSIQEWARADIFNDDEYAMAHLVK